MRRSIYLSLILAASGPSAAEAACDGTGRGLRVLTFNAQLTGLIMDGHVSDYGDMSDEDRAMGIALRVKGADPDVAVFQEVWNDNGTWDVARDILVEELQDKYPHWVTDAGCGGLEDSGLVIVSKWPFVDQNLDDEPGPVGEDGEGLWGDSNSNLDQDNEARFLCFNDVRMPDQLADKGVLMVEIEGECGIRKVHVLTAHAQANGSNSVPANEECRRCEEREYKRKNLGDVRYMIENLLTPFERATDYVIVGADLNVSYNENIDPTDPTNEDMQAYCEGDTDQVAVCYGVVHGEFGTPAKVDILYNFMFDAFEPGGATSAFEHNEFFSCTQAAMGTVTGDFDVCPANAGGTYTPNQPFLVDPYLSEHPSTHMLSKTRPINDFILHNKPRAADGGPVRSCTQHIREVKSLTGLSDHTAIVVDYNDTQPRCSPFPWQPATSIPAALLPAPEVVDAPNNNNLSSPWGPEYVVWDLDDYTDVDRSFNGTNPATPEDFATGINQAGSVQWYVIYQPSAWDIELSASVQHDVYHHNDLSTPINFVGNCTTTGELDGMQQLMTKCTYAGYEPPYYVKVYGWNQTTKRESRTFSGPYWIKFHRRNCSSVADACPLKPGFKTLAVFPDGQLLGPDDTAYFSFSTEEDFGRNFPVLEMQLSHDNNDVMSTVFGAEAACDPVDCPGIPFEEKILDESGLVDVSPFVVHDPAEGEMSVNAEGRWFSARQPDATALPGDDRGNGSTLYSSTRNYYGFPKNYLYTVRRRSDVSPTYVNNQIDIEVAYTTTLTYFEMVELICVQERTDISDWGIEDDIAFQLRVVGDFEHHVTVTGASVTAPPTCSDPSHPQCSYLPNSGDCEPGMEGKWYDDAFSRALRLSSTFDATLNPFEDAIDADFFNLGASTLISLPPNDTAGIESVQFSGDDWEYHYRYSRSHDGEDVGCTAGNGNVIAGACDLAGLPGYTGSSGYKCCLKGADGAKASRCTHCIAAGYGAGCASPPPSIECLP